ncbi:hypothetical protein J6590_040551 [Homalodisca vitripennis]|nr:hypothetical protein J6590_040551 [Homalodisca vitripennis]
MRSLQKVNDGYLSNIWEGSLTCSSSVVSSVAGHRIIKSDALSLSWDPPHFHYSTWSLLLRTDVEKFLLPKHQPHFWKVKQAAMTGPVLRYLLSKRKPYAKVISHILLFTGPYKVDKLTEAVEDLSKKLGPIFRLRLNGEDIVITVDANDTRTMYQHEGLRPHRPSFPALYYYRKKNFNSVGIVPGNGDEWYHYRKAITPILNTKLLQTYLDRQHVVANRFTDYIEKQKNEDGTLTDLYSHLLKFSIEGKLK